MALQAVTVSISCSGLVALFWCLTAYLKLQDVPLVNVKLFYWSFKWLSPDRTEPVVKFLHGCFVSCWMEHGFHQLPKVQLSRHCIANTSTFCHQPRRGRSLCQIHWHSSVSRHRSLLFPSV